MRGQLKNCPLIKNYSLEILINFDPQFVRSLRAGPVYLQN